MTSSSDHPVRKQWRFWIDRGGTFTDVIGLDPDDRIHTCKLLSDNAAHYSDAALEGVRRILSLTPGAALPGAAIQSIKMGTTVATNALLERKGAATAFVTTKGFGDAVRIGTQNRPRIFDLNIQLPDMLYTDVVELDERMSAEGAVLSPLDTTQVRAQLQALRDKEITSLAVCLLHGYAYPDHERQVGDIARALGFAQISLSHEVSPLIKMVGRADTTLVDAYLSPVLHAYIDRVTETIADDDLASRLYFMQSNGGLVRADKFNGKDAILSGPAGGVVGMAETAKAHGIDKVIGFDMGGTSTDVSHFAGTYERTFEGMTAGVRVRSPMMNIHTVAAGGGSIIHFDGARLRVGPQSAGADPGPAAYRKGGPLTVTDANVMTGKLLPDLFPAVFGPSADEPLDAAAVRDKFSALAADMGDDRPVEEIADGCIRIAVQAMANAIKKISVARGYDVTGYTLNCFGGAGAQHACLVADALGMTSILIHPLASLLSAFGMGLADIRAHREYSAGCGLTGAALGELREIIEDLQREATADVREQGVTDARIATTIVCHVKYRGSDSTLPVDLASADEMAHAFHALHKSRYGFSQPDAPLIVETVAVESIGHMDRPAIAANRFGTRAGAGRHASPDSPGCGRFFSSGQWHDAAIFFLADIASGTNIPGPALLIDPHSTIVVESRWAAQMQDDGSLILSRGRDAGDGVRISAEIDPIQLEIFNNLFMTVAEQMGFALQNTASSVNIKERLDFSCAIFDAQGGLVANAPHIPVHLGSMGASVQAVIEAFAGSFRPGDVFALNNPYRGGTHLPDVTVVAPVFDRDGSTIVFYSAARGHHADVGGISPGSMPAQSRTLSEEGIIINPMRIIRDGAFDDQAVRAVLLSGPTPARNPDQNMADLKAQAAACDVGAQELLTLVNRYGLSVVSAYMGHVQTNAAACVRRAIGQLRSGAAEIPMDNGSAIRVRISIDAATASAIVDFTGTSAQVDGNLNAPAAISRAAVLYVFRCLVRDDIPLNEGCLAPIQLILPDGSLLNPAEPAAVVAGNVETSQHITDALFSALGVLAGAQGTMNNLSFGSARMQYYETICGGAGAGADFDGASAVQSHMTNSRLTDPEILESRFPVRIRSFRIRPHSGGNGVHRGGDGVVRSLTFLESMTVSLLSLRRITQPPGLAGGEPGQSGRNRLERADGTCRDLSGCEVFDVAAGDTVIIMTPGGGGYGRPLAD